MRANADAVVRRQETSEEDVLVMEYTWHDHSLIILHNFADKPRAVRISAKTAGTRTLVDLLWTNDSRADQRGIHEVELEPYAYRWFRARGEGRNVPRG